MTVFVLPEDAADHVAFVYSSLWEAAVSLRVLARPRRHPVFHPMVRKVERVAPHLVRTVRALEFGLTPGFLVPTAEAAGVSFEDQLEMLGGLDDDDVRDEFMYDARVYAGESLGTILEPPPPADEIVASVGRIRPQLVPMARMAIDEPHRLLGVLSDLLSEYWTVFFREEWDRIGPRLGEAVADARRTVAAVGLSHALPSLSRYFGMTASTGELRVLAKELDTHPHRVSIGPGQRLHLVPSIYAWPQVWANCDPPWPLAITYPAPSIEEETRPPIPDEELAEVLHALGDGTRLRLLPLLSSRPRTTQELARVVRLSEATVSRHLSVLRAAGLVASRREGRFVLYWLVPDRASTLSSLLLDFITGDWDGGRESGTVPGHARSSIRGVR